MSSNIYKQPIIRSDSPLLKPCPCLVFLSNQPAKLRSKCPWVSSLWLHHPRSSPPFSTRDSSFRDYLKCTHHGLRPAGCNLLSLGPYTILAFLWLLCYCPVLQLLYTCISPTHCKTPPRSSCPHFLHLQHSILNIQRL